MNELTGRKSMRKVCLGASLGLLAVAILSSLALVAHHSYHIELPGCGPRSPCDRAASSPWGTIPGIRWPLSHAGLAFFLSMFVACIASHGQLSRSLRWFVRLAAGASAFLITIMVLEDYLCLWCLAVHLANLCFCVVVELGAPPYGESRRPMLWFASLAVATTTALAIINIAFEHESRKQQEGERVKSGQRIAAMGFKESRFTGRYLNGPEKALIRIVIFGDYACPVCLQIDSQVATLLRTRTNISFSFKHYPLSATCNKSLRAKSLDLYPNSCQAAWAAETAGILGGDATFFAMHEWLIKREGKFKEAELFQFVDSLGLSTDLFRRTMVSPEVRQRILEDVDEGERLGILSTPMVFVNGIELKGIGAENALIRTVDWLKSTKSERQLTVADQPPSALEKYVADWRDGLRVCNISSDPWARGSSKPLIDVIVWGDLVNSETDKLDTAIRAKLAGTPHARYSFRHFPLSSTCNPLVSKALVNEASCLAARAAEAGGRFAGVAGFWAIHSWIKQNRESLDVDSLSTQIHSIGIEYTRFARVMNSPEVTTAINQDVAEAKRLGVPAIPLLYVNGLWVPRWYLEGEDVLFEIFAAARAESGVSIRSDTSLSGQ